MTTYRSVLSILAFLEQEERFPIIMGRDTPSHNSLNSIFSDHVHIGQTNLLNVDHINTPCPPPHINLSNPTVLQNCSPVWTTLISPILPFYKIAPQWNPDPFYTNRRTLFFSEVFIIVSVFSATQARVVARDWRPQFWINSRNQVSQKYKAGSGFKFGLIQFGWW